MSKVYDCIIIGGGPSGLIAGNVIAQVNSNFLIIEKGDYLYNRDPVFPTNIVSGICGGGLFSDGKISFFPSGSNLYKLDDSLLKKAYHFLNDMFSSFNVNIPEYDEMWAQNTHDYKKSCNINQKEYQSIVLTQDQLYKLGFYLYDQIGKDRFLIKHEVTKISQINNLYLIEVVDKKTDNTIILKSKNIIFCGGKFGSIKMPLLIREELVFKKFEFGIRIETEPDFFDYKEIPQIDLKLILPDRENDGIEFRTFCFCRNGYIVHGKFEDMDSYNGVSSKNDFTKTNFGLNLRIKDENTFKKFQTELQKLENSESIIKQDIKEFLSQRNTNWSEPLYQYFQNCLTEYFPEISRSNAEITGPSFEYFGYYPILDNELKVSNHNFWVSGDATGDFRGLLPALLSGYISAASMLIKANKEKETLFNLIRIKSSSTKKTKTIFAAQSKKYFYCKDAVCEFIFNCGYIPLHPFQVFGYFLNDRVDREMVRLGNNEIISRCDEVWVFGSIANGVLFEIARAYDLRMPVRFYNINTFSNGIEEITDINKLIFEPEVHSRIGKENLIKFISQFYLKDDEKPQLMFDFNELSQKN